MTETRKKKHDEGSGGGWLYLGAAGILQPLSEEFLYRSPSDALRRGTRHVSSDAAEVRNGRA